MNDSFLRACRREKTGSTPVWFMRQAGRYLPEYRELRTRHDLLEIARTPALAAEVTLQPLRRFGFDAAIVFADILLPLQPMGAAFSFQKGEGPVIEKPVRHPHDIDQLSIIDAGKTLGFVAETIRLVKKDLTVPLIGFAGGPFTLASYLIEGGHSRHYQLCKSLMYREPKAWHALLDKLAAVTISYLSMQIEAGADAIQLFDSWVGVLSVADYRNYVFPHSRKILSAIAERHPKVPRIHFGTGTASLLNDLHAAGATVVGIDWQTPLSVARQALPDAVAIQGNLDPLALFAPPEILVEKVAEVLQAAGPDPGHIFNLGHGILPETPVENVALVIDEVKRRSKR